MPHNPYRDAFYSRQAAWHGYTGPEHVEAKHRQRAPYYAWYTRGWISGPLDAPILDIGCGSGQFLYFLKQRGFTQAVGIDLDTDQVEIGRALGLDCRRAHAAEFLASEPTRYGVIAMLDILEHFTREELFPLMQTVADHLAPGGSLIVSVPNADSPRGLHTVYSDITHELSFTPESLGELMFCHGLRVTDIHDPWPAPVSPMRKVYWGLANVMRGLEAARLRLLGMEPPKYWSTVIWARAVKPTE